ncbi:MAG: hypothetical protein ABI968_13385, partial [Acidobacteriota bacterium]
ASKAQAEPFGHHGSFHGRTFAHRTFAPIRHRAFARPYYRPFHTFAPRVAFASPRPYRLVRVFVYAPYPHWVLRRVYTPYYPGAYCPY